MNDHSGVRDKKHCAAQARVPNVINPYGVFAEVSNEKLSLSCSSCGLELASWACGFILSARVGLRVCLNTRCSSTALAMVHTTTRGNQLKGGIFVRSSNGIVSEIVDWFVSRSFTSSTGSDRAHALSFLLSQQFYVKMNYQQFITFDSPPPDVLYRCSCSR